MLQALLREKEKTGIWGALNNLILFSYNVTSSRLFSSKNRIDYNFEEMLRYQNTI